jgi:hypothetical protein
LPTRITKIFPRIQRSFLQDQSETQIVTKRTVGKEHANDRVQRVVARGSRGDVSVVSEKDDVDQLAKKAKIDEMWLVINLKKIEAINTQIAVMERLENVYVARMERDAYERKLVNLANKLPDMLELRRNSHGTWSS